MHDLVIGLFINRYEEWTINLGMSDKSTTLPGTEIGVSISNLGSKMSVIPEEIHLNIGAIIFPNLDQTDFTAPFEVLSRLPNSAFHILWKEKMPVKDVKGLILTPEKTLLESPPLDLLLVPGGYGQEALMEDETVLAFIREQAVNAKYVFSVCTGALICGAAGLLKGVRATTHWSAFHLLEYFGAIPIDERVVIDDKFVSAAGVTAELTALCEWLHFCAAIAWLRRFNCKFNMRLNPRLIVVHQQVHRLRF